MNEKEIREAVEVLGVYQKYADAFYRLQEKRGVKFSKGRLKFRADVKNSVQISIDTLTQYLECGGVLPPEKEANWHENGQEYGSCYEYVCNDMARGFNLARHEFILVMMKKTDIHNLSQVTIPLIEKHFPKGRCKERGAAIVLHAEMLIALRTHILGGKE